MLNGKLMGSQWLSCNSSSIKKYYNEAHASTTHQQWSYCVWNRLTIPKHRFIMWMDVKDRLKISARLKKMNISDNDSCQICAQHVEDIPHLFFGCEFSVRYIMKIVDWLRIG